MFGARMILMVCAVAVVFVAGCSTFQAGEQANEPVLHKLEITLTCVTPSVMSLHRDSTVMLLPKEPFFFGENEYRVMEAFSADSTIYTLEKDTEFERRVGLTVEFIGSKGLIALVRIHEFEFL